MMGERGTDDPEIENSEFAERAMRCSLIVLLSALIGGSQGCMTFQNGLCTPGESGAIFDPILLGEWTPIDPKLQVGEEGYFKVERDDSVSKAYRVSAISL